MKHWLKVACIGLLVRMFALSCEGGADVKASQRPCASPARRCNRYPRVDRWQAMTGRYSTCAKVNNTSITLAFLQVDPKKRAPQLATFSAMGLLTGMGRKALCLEIVARTSSLTATKSFLGWLSITSLHTCPHRCMFNLATGAEARVPLVADFVHGQRRTTRSDE